MGSIDIWRQKSINLARDGASSGREIDIFENAQRLESLSGDRMKNRVAFMPGSTCGINQATAMLYALQGGTVIFNGHTMESETKFEEIKNLLRSAGVPEDRLAFVRFDISTPFDRKARILQIKDRFKLVDLLQLGPAIGAGQTDLVTVQKFNIGANIALLDEFITNGLFKHESDLVYDASNASHDWNGTHVMDESNSNARMYNRIYDLVARTKNETEITLVRRQEALWRRHGIRLVVIVAPLVTDTKPVEVLRKKQQLHNEVVKQFGITDRLTVALAALDAVTQPYNSGPILKIVDSQHTKVKNWLE